METLADTGLGTMKRFKLLQELELKPVEDQSHEWPKHLFLAQFNRFELWAVNLGVFVMGHGSLDYRIRDSENMKEAILQMMKNLNRSLEEVLAYLHGNIEQRDEDEDTDSCSDMESDMDLLLDSIKDPIDRLYKMAVWIRNPATRIPSTKARNLQQVDEETNVDLFKSFENFDYDHVSSLFLEYEKSIALQKDPIPKPYDAVGDGEALIEDQVWEPIRKTLELNRVKLSNGNESYLIRRIARANGLRRQQFAYWRKHKNKLREHATLAVEVPSHNLPTTSHFIQLEDNNGKIKAPLTVTTATQLRLSHETGKELETENAMTLAVSEYAPSAWNPSKDTVSFPLPPKISTTEEYFECPYCYTICPASILSEKAWRAHIIRDLRPYICTFEHCSNSEQLYDSRDDWIEHETSMHQTVRRCPMHEEETFTTLATYIEHTQKYHTKDAMPPDLAKSTTIIHRKCPICSIDLMHMKKLPSHIALHLERFAMFALPRCTDDNDGRISGGRSASAHGYSERSFIGDLDTESNATSKTRSNIATYYEILTEIRAMSDKIATLRSPEGIVSRDEERCFFEEMKEIKFQLKNYRELVRVWPPSNTTNIALFELGDICIAAGLIYEAIETLEHLEFLQISQLEHDDLELLQTTRRLARAYKVNEALQEVDEQLGHDADLHIEPSKSKALDIFARTEAGMKHAQTIWGPNIWNIQQTPQVTVDKTQQESYAQALQPSTDLAQEELELSEDGLTNDGRRLMETTEEVGEGCIRRKDSHLLLDVVEISRSESAGAEGELKSDLLDEKVQNWISDAEKSQNQQPQDKPSIIRDDFGNRNEGSNVPESIDHAGHSRQGPGRVDRDRPAPGFRWTPAYEATFFRNLCESVQLGMRENGSFKAEAWERAAQALQEHHGAYPAKSHLINKSNNARKRFQLWRGLREDPDFIYNPVSRTVTATEEAWKAHIKREPSSRALRGRPFDHEEYMEVLYPEMVGNQLHHDSAMPGTSVLDLPDAQKPVEVTKLQAEEASQKLKQMKEQGVPPNDPEYVKVSKFLLNFQQQHDRRQNQHQTQQIVQDSQDAKGDLIATNVVAEQETTNKPRRLTPEEVEERGERHDLESEISVLREMFRILVDESQAEFEQAAEGTELKLEAQTLAQTLAQHTASYMSDVQELKSQFFGATQMLERSEKGTTLLYKIRSFDFVGMRETIKEIQNKREAQETREVREAREAQEARKAREARIIRHISDANFELTDHKETKQRAIERLEKALEAMHAGRGQEDSSAASGELEVRDPSTEVSLRTKTSESELNSYRESISEEEEKIRSLLGKIEALEEEFRLARAENEVQVPSGSESQKT